MDVNLSGYQDNGFGGFGSEQEVDSLIKAMQAGQITGRDTTNQLLGAEPLKAESLETTLKLLEFRTKDIKLWNAIPKLTAYNTVEEYNQLVSYGSDRGGFYNEGELSDVEDSQYERRSELIKFIQVTKEVTYQAQLVKSYIDVMRKEVENGTMWVVRRANSSLTKGNSDIISQEWAGLYQQHGRFSGANAVYSSLDAYTTSPAVIDLRGAALRQGNLEDAAINIDAAFGGVSDLFCPPSVIAGLGKDYYQRQRILLAANGGYTGTPGVNPKGIDTTFGTVTLNQDKGMKAGAAKLLSAAATSSKAPNAPLAVNYALASDAITKFAAGETFTGALGTVYYAVSAINRYGESALTVIQNTTPITLTAGSSVDITFTDGGGANASSGYTIYRSKVTAATNATTGLVTFYPIFNVSVANLAAGFDGGAAGVIRDRNRFLPNTEQGFVTEMVDDVLSFKQLAPIGQLNLATTAMAKRFIVFLFGAAFLYTPFKLVRFVNIGPYTGS